MDLQTRKDEAMAVLIDEIIEIKNDLKKADLLIQELQGEYFDKYNYQNKEDREAIVIEFDRNKVYGDIISDYVFQAKQRIEKLEARGDEIVRSEAV